MEYQVLVKLNAGKNEVVLDGGYLVVSVTEPPSNNRANRKITQLLAKYFKVSKSEVEIVSGMRSRKKLISIG